MKKNNNNDWPLLLRVKTKTLFLTISIWLLFAWFLFLANDILSLLDLGSNRPIWDLMFNDRPIEWTQWFLLAFAIICASYISGREKNKGISSFFFLLAVGLGLMLIEEAGDIRHVISSEVLKSFGEKPLGINYRVLSDIPYFTALSIVPVYAVLKYGKNIWKFSKTRTYLIISVSIYATAAIASGLRHFNDFYVRLGAWIDSNLFQNKFPVPDYFSQEWSHFLLVDSVLEESIELMAATFMLAVTLSYIEVLRRKEK